MKPSVDSPVESPAPPLFLPRPPLEDELPPRDAFVVAACFGSLAGAGAGAGAGVDWATGAEGAGPVVELDGGELMEDERKAQA